MKKPTNIVTKLNNFGLKYCVVEAEKDQIHGLTSLSVT